MTSAAIYARISQDRTGEQFGVERQLAECRELAARLGLTVVAEYIDNDVSATSGKRRPQFEALLASAPEAIVAWHQDRLLRKGSDLERVISLNVPVYTVSAGTLDLTTPAGRAVARTVAAWSQYEGEQKAERQRSKNRQRTEEGKPYMAHRVFGWESDGITVREDEAAIIREMHDRILRGETIRSTTAWLNAQGSTQAKTGNPWTHAAVRAALTRKRNAGVLEAGGVVQPVSQIAPIVTAAEHEAVVAILNARKQPGRPLERWWLSGAMHCHCGSPVGSKTVRGKNRATPSYVCRVSIDTAKGGHAAIGAEIAHDAVREALHIALVIGGGYEDSSNDDVVRLRADLSGIETERASVMEMWTLPGADQTWITARVAFLGLAHEQAEAQLAGVLAERATSDVAASIREAFVAPGEDHDTALAGSYERFLAAFDALDVEQKRELVRAKLTVKINPAKGHGYGAKRLEIAAR